MFINKLLAYLLVILVTAACSRQLSDADYIERARDQLDQGDLKTATIELKNALQQNAKNSQARWLLGKVYLDIGNDAAAEKELKRALDLGIASETIYPLLAHAYLEQGKYPDILNLQVNGLSSQTQAEILALQGAALIAQHKLDDAANKINQALEKQPDSVIALTEQIRLKIARGASLQQARELLNALLQEHDAYAPAWSLLAEVDREDEKFAQAETDLNRAIKLRPGNKIDRLKRAQVRIQLKKYRAAQRDVDILKKQIPNYFELHYAQGLIYFHQQQYDKALTSFEAAIKGNEQFLPVIYYLGVTHYALGQLEQANKYISRFLLENPGFVPGRKLLAQIQIKYGEYADVEELMQPIVNRDPKDIEALNLLALAQLLQHQDKKGVALLERAVELRPKSANAHLVLGSSLLDTGSEQQGIEHLKRAEQLDPEMTKASEIIIRYYIKSKQLDKALAAANAYRDNHPDTASSYNFLGMSHLARNEIQQAKQAFTRAVDISPGDISANHNLAAIAISEKDFSTARQYYGRVLKHHKDDLDTLIKLALLDDRMDRTEDMVKHLQQAIKTHPGAIRPRIALARYYLASGAYDQVSNALGDILETQGDNPMVLDVMGRTQLAQDKGTDAKIAFERLVEIEPNSAQAHYLLALSHAQLGDIPALKSELHKSIKLDSGHLPARMALARLSLIENDQNEFNTQLTALKRIAPDNPDVMLLEGMEARTSGKQNEALDIYTRVFDNVSSTTSMLALARQKWGMGDRAGALVLLEKWVDKHPDDITARLRLANVYIASDRQHDAIDQYTAVIDRADNNIVALNNLAWLLRKQDIKQAVKFADQAAALAPSSEEILDTSGSVYLEAGNAERASILLGKAADIAPDNYSIQFHLAESLVALKNIPEATRILETITTGQKKFPEEERARELLKTIQ